MKLRIYPKKEAVLDGLLQEKGELEDLLFAANESLAAISDGKALIVEPTKESRLRSDAAAYEYQIKAIMDKVTLIESHSPPEVMVEIDL